MNVSENEVRQKTAQVDDGDGISLVDLAATLWRRKLLIVAVTAVAAILSVAYALMQPNIFTASATVLPISGSSSSLMSQYAGLASLAGVSLPSGGSSNPVIKIEAIFRSRGFAENLVGKLNLLPLLIEHPEKIKVGTPMETAVRILQNILSISTDTKTSVMKISAKTRSATLSSTIANGALDMIQEDLSARVLSSSGKNIILLEQQVADQGKRVQAAQDKVTTYLRKNKLVAPQAQSAGGLQLYQTLIQQRITLEIEISRLESALSPDNPKIVGARTQLEAIKAQIANLEKDGDGVGPSIRETPATLMEYTNLTSELELVTKVYGSLLSSLESMKLQDDAEKVFVEVIDRAIPPTMKSEPSRSMICVVGTMAGGFLSVLLAFLLDAVGKLAADPEVRAKFSGGEKSKLVRMR